MAFNIVVLTRVLCRSLRFRLRVFLVRIWLFIEWLRFTLPLPVSLKRLHAPRCDFCFGMMSPVNPLGAGAFPLVASSLPVHGSTACHAKVNLPEIGRRLKRT